MATAEQLKWLKLAGKGLKKSKDRKKLMKNFDNFDRRSRKVDELMEGIPFTGSNNPRTTISNIIRKADETAKDGDFKAAYEQLKAAKDLARAYIKDFPDSEEGLLLRPKLERIENSFRGRAAIVDEFEETTARTMDELAGFQKVSEATSFEEACIIANTFTAAEPGFRSRFFKLNADLDVLGELAKVGYTSLESQHMAVKAYVLAGKQKLVEAELALAEEMEALHEEYCSRYSPRDHAARIAEANLAFELAIRDIKDMTRARELYQQENAGGDAPGQEAVARLKQSTDQERLDLLEKEQKTLNWARQEYLALQGRTNTETERALATPVAELAEFNPGDVFGGITGFDDDFSDLRTPERKAEIMQGAIQCMDRLAGQHGC